MEKTAARMHDQYSLKGFAFAMDGCIMRLKDQPGGLPADKHPQLFWNQKQDYAMNVQFICNNPEVCDVDVG